MKSIVFYFFSFWVALLPQDLKRYPSVARFNLSSMHILSGSIEVFLFGFLFIAGFMDRGSQHSTRLFRTAVSSGDITHLDRRAMASLQSADIVAYVIEPNTLVYEYFIIEGAVRAAESLIGGKDRGIVLLYVPFAIWQSGRRKYSKARLKHALGPPRPDVVREADRSPSGMLEIFTVEEKPWSDRQKLKYKGEFYALCSKTLEPKGDHHAYHYCFRKLGPSEVIRGEVVLYGPREPRDPTVQTS